MRCLPFLVIFPVVLAIVQVVLAITFYTRGWNDLSKLTIASFADDLQRTSWTSTADVALLGGVNAVVLVFLPITAYMVPLACVRCCRRSVLAWAVAGLFSALAAYALAKVVGAPAADGFFWGGSISLFSFACIGAFVCTGVIGRVYAWAIRAVADRFLGSGWDKLNAKDPAAVEAKAKAARQRSRNIKRLLTLSAPDWRYVLTGFAFLSLAALGNTFLPRLISNTLSAVAIDNDTAAFNREVLVLGAVSLGTAVAAGARAWAFTIALARLRVRLRDRLLRALLVQEQGFFDGASTGDLTSRLSADTTSVSDQLSLNVNVLLRSLISLIGSLIMMFLLSWRLTLLSFCVLPPIVVLSMTYGRFVSRLSKLSQRRLADCNDIANEGLASIATVRAFGAEAREADRHADVLADYYDAQARTAKAYSGYSVITTFLPTVVIALILYCGGQLVAAGALSGGDLLSVVLYQFSTAASFASLGDIYSGLASAVGAAEKIFALLDREPRIHAAGSYVPGTGMPKPTATATADDSEASAAAKAESATAVTTAAAPASKLDEASAAPIITPKPVAAATASATSFSSASATALALPDRSATALTPLPLQLPPLPLAPGDPDAFAAEIVFHGVTFAYPTRPEVAVLRDFSLHVPAASVCALVGPSGHGKSSIVKLLARAYEPDTGVITLGGVPLAAFDVAWLRRAVSIVGQEPTLFARSVWENVLLGADGAEVTEDAMGGSRALMPFAQALGLQAGEADAARVLAALPRYQQVRAGAHTTSSSTPAGAGAGAGAGAAAAPAAWVTDPNTVDNVPAIRAAAALRRKLLHEYRREARTAVDSLTVHARGRLAGLLLQQARSAAPPPTGTRGSKGSLAGSLNSDASVSDVRQPLLAGAATATATSIVDSSGALAAADVEHGKAGAASSFASPEQLLASVPPEALLSALVPAHDWNAGVPRSSVLPPSESSVLTRPAVRAAAVSAASGSSSGSAPAPATGTGSREEQEKKRLTRKLQRARRVREFIRAHRLAQGDGRIAGLSAEDRALLEQWYPLDSAAGGGGGASGVASRSVSLWPLTAAADVGAPDGLAASPDDSGAKGAPVPVHLSTAGGAIPGAPVPVHLSTSGGAVPGARGTAAASASDPQSLLAELGYDLGEDGEDDDAGAGAAGAGSGGRGGGGAEDDDDAALGLTPATGATHGLPPLTPTLETVRRVLAAARVANAADFVRELPDGFDSVMGEKAGTVSGGQRQRLCIARAIVRDCRVLLLDEATAALDAESEAVVTEALNRAMTQRGRTTLVVAHRLSTVRDANKIVVIRDGQAVEEGTHDALIARDGAYAKLVRRQLQASSTPAGIGAGAATPSLGLPDSESSATLAAMAGTDE